jgi:macrolide-specific efflux system membrane fusion protein
MSRRIALMAGVVFVVAAALVVWLVFLRGGGTSERTAVVTRRDALSSSIRATGKLDVTGRVSVPLTQAGTVRLIAVRVGDGVRAGDVLAQLDDTRQRQDVQAAQDALDAAQYTLTNARRGGNGVASVVTAEAQVQDAQRRVDSAQAALRGTLVVAPMDGTVLSIAAAEKGTYNQGQELLQLANLNNLILNIDLDEVDVPRLGDNRTTQITFDAFPGQTVNGTLVSVAPLATNQGGRTTYTGTVTFPRPQGLDLRPGMGADVSIATRTERNVLVVPDLAIETIGSKTYVTVIHPDNTRERVEVRTGLRAEGVVVIASGVDEGTRVALPSR